ncbi:MAG: spore coat protein [bacterium]|nr:spore coat protein [bacterium]
MNNVIKNKKEEVSNGIELNDKDYLNSINSTLKEMVKNYSVVLTEASNENLFKVYKKIFDNIITMQRQTFELIFEKGWYILEKAEKNKINNKFSTLNQEFIDLNNQE